jgi:hypothetical protein
LGAPPITINPPMPTLSPTRTCIRVDKLSACAGVSTRRRRGRGDKVHLSHSRYQGATPSPLTLLSEAIRNRSLIVCPATFGPQCCDTVYVALDIAGPCHPSRYRALEVSADGCVIAAGA